MFKQNTMSSEFNNILNEEKKEKEDGIEMTYNEI